MARSYADELNLPTFRVAGDNSMTNRPIKLPACVTSGLASIISLFCIGLVSGAPGGLLLGATAVTLLQSLERLADNKLFKDQLEEYIKKAQGHDINVSAYTLLSVFFPSLLSLAAGIFIGLSTYSLVIKKEGEAVKTQKKARRLAGLVCLTVVTATGYTLGFTLEKILSILLNVDIRVQVFISVLICILPVPAMLINYYLSLPLLVVLLIKYGVKVGHDFVFLFDNSSLIVVLTPVVVTLKLHEQLHSLTLITVTVPLALLISDIYYITGQQIIALQSPTSTDTSNVVPESIFFGLSISLLWMVNIGMILFVNWQRGGADKICAAAVGLGTAVLTAIKVALPVLGPGPSIGALMGVAGAVGVSLSAAVAATDQYGQREGHYRFVGRVGVTMGAAVGAFLSSCAHSGLSGMFMGLCAATIPAGAFF